LMVQENDCYDNRGIGLGHRWPSFNSTCGHTTMAQANAHAAGAQQPARYEEVYSTMPDVLNGQSALYLVPFSPESVEQPATLRDRSIMATASDHVPKVYVMMQADPTQQVLCIHCPTRYATSLIGTMPWDDCIFGFQGDIRQGQQVNIIEWPKSPFVHTGYVTMPTLAEMDTAWLATVGADTVGTLAVSAPGTEQL
jgi:hypothetical protein